MDIQDINVGDRVYCTSLNLVGTAVDFILDPRADYQLVGVDFAPEARFHDLSDFRSLYGVKLPEPTGWWCFASDLKLVESAEDEDHHDISSSSVLEFLVLGLQI